MGLSTQKSIKIVYFCHLLGSDMTSVMALAPEKCGTESSKVLQNHLTKFRVLKVAILAFMA